jgi:hypothetical protein
LVLYRVITTACSEILTEFINELCGQNVNVLNIKLGGRQTNHWALKSGLIKNKVCRDSSVGIAAHFELDGPRIEAQWGARFSASVQTHPGAHPSFLYNG